MDLLTAYSLSKLLVTAVLCYSSQTFAQESCGHIGDTCTTPTDTVAETDTETSICSPPASEREGDSPAQTRQLQAYQSIMKNRRLQQICNFVSALK